MDKKRLTKEIKRKGLELGFSKVGITTADDFTEFEAEIRSRPDYDLWVNTKKAFLGKGSKPRSFYPEAKSIVCAVYSFADIKYPEELEAYIARVYLSRSYKPHEGSIHRLRFDAFSEFMESSGCNIYHTIGEIRIPDRMACARAGIITFGKNNFAYTDDDGSSIILYTFIVDRELEYDEPTIECKCPPKCRACIDACPTKAILSPGRMHPQDCLIYNHCLDDRIPAKVMQNMGTNIHGCDICQNVCPRNKKILKKAFRKDAFLEEIKKDFDLEKILLMDEEYFKEVLYPIVFIYKLSPDIIKRNAAIALGNTGDPSHIPALEEAAKSQNPLIKDAAEWAIKNLKG